jgi:hypothetical protein
VRHRAPPLVRVLRDGAVVIEQEAKVLSQPPPGPGIYRVEADIDERLRIAGAPIRRLLGARGVRQPIHPQRRTNFFAPRTATNRYHQILQRFRCDLNRNRKGSRLRFKSDLTPCHAWW